MVGEIVMTIEEKAKEFAGYNISFPGMPTIAEMDSRYDGFKAGAEWMLEEAADWIIDNVVFDKFGRSINIENFRKAMEE